MGQTDPRRIGLTGPPAPGYYLAHESLALGPFTEVDDMTWEAPDFVELKMDAEINSYQDDFDKERDDDF